MKRRLLKLYMTFSLVLALGLCALWAISGIRGDEIAWFRHNVFYVLRSDRGYLGMARAQTFFDVGGGAAWTSDGGGYTGATYGTPSFSFFSDLISFRRGPYDGRGWHVQNANSGAYVHLTVSYAVPVAALAVPPLIWFAIGWNRRRQLNSRQRFNLCTICGYDLRGGSGGRCPECGNAPLIATAPTTS